MKNKPAKLNRSLRLKRDEIKKYSSRPIKLNKKVKTKSIINKVINQDIFVAVKYLPEKFVDLLFMDHKEYEDWLDSWLSKLIKILKADASIYICGDWKSSSSIFRVGSKYFQVRNRITWEREKGRGAIKNWKNCSEDIWFFTNSNNFTFNVSDVKLRRKVLAPYRDKEKNPKDWKVSNYGNFRTDSIYRAQWLS